ncbi:MAG: HAMP domain-containing protein [Deltaproteobacteria bacterium]|nr:HAMP domain-containing protein [Deltaproteobacteria bacterium]
MRLSLKVKLSLLITSLLVLTVLLVSAFLLRQQQSSLTAEMIKRGLTIAQDMAASAKNPLLTNDELTLNLLVQDSMKDEDVAYVVITDQDEKILAHRDVTLIGRPLERAKELKPVNSTTVVQTYTDPKEGKLIDFGVPLEFRKVRLGAIYLGFSQKSIERKLSRSRNQTILITLAMILVGIGGAVGLSAFLSRPILRLLEGTQAIGRGNFQVALSIPSRDEIGDLTASFNQMAKSLREKEMIKLAFSRYVAREVVDEILKNPEHTALTGERRDVTVLFCDMRGFTPLCERLPPEEVLHLLNEFYTLMIDTTFANEGTLDKFLGDAVMAIFGAPIAYPDHSMRAIRTAVAMKTGIEQLSRKRVEQGKEPIAVGIGVSAGEAIAGTVGTENRMEYTVIGDRVNLAARLESNAAAGQILISQWTYDKVASQVDVRSLGTVRVKGKEENVEVYEVLGLVP